MVLFMKSILWWDMDNIDIDLVKPNNNAIHSHNLIQRKNYE